MALASRVAVLIAEDSATQAERLRAVLEDAGYEIEVARSGTEALAAARARPPALVISDVLMPELDGYALCGAIKSDDALRDTPVVLLTSLNSPLDVVKGLACGADNFIRKPYEDTYLLLRLRHILSNRELRRSEKTRVGVEIELAGQRHLITAERQQLLDMLISTSEEAVQLNEDLQARERELARSYQSLSAIYRMAENLNRCRNEPEVTEHTLDRVLALPGVGAGWIFLRQKEGFRLAGARGLPPALVAPGTLEGECLCQRQLLAGELERAVNILECERLGRPTGDEAGGLRYHASVPLRIGDEVVGILNLAGTHPGLFGEEELRVLHGVGNQVGVALERARLYEHLEEQVRVRTAALDARQRQQAAVAALGQDALAGRSLPSLMDKAVALVADTLGVALAKVLELLPKGDAFVLRAAVGFGEGSVGRATVPAGTGSQAGFTLLNGAPVIVTDFATEARFRPPDLLRAHGVVSGVSVAIVGSQRSYGVLGAHTTRRRTFTADDVQFLTSMAHVLGAAIERQRAEESLRRSEERYRDLFENANDAVYALDLQGRFIAVNRAGEQILGRRREEILGRRFPEIVAPEHHDLAREQFRRILAGETGPATVELDVVTNGGLRTTLDAGNRLIRERGEPVRVEGIARDIGERKRLEAQFHQAQKMDAVGRLAGGIAHDFNNVLAVVAGYADILLRRLPEGDALRRYPSEIGRAAQRAAGLVRQLLAFSRRQVLSPKVLDLNAVVADVEAMLRRVLGEDVDLVTALKPGVGHMRADPSQIEQILLNLAINARDAMPGGGKLTIETDDVYLGPAYVRSLFEVPPGPYTMLAVTDTGHGMDEATRARIFEPFFTTKEQGKGTGLGLATVHGIVKQSGGDIHVYSEPGRGTTFKVYLPQVREAAEALPARQAPGEEAPRGQDTLLVAEDEDGVRALIREVLEEAGYTVLTAPEGEAALALAASHPGPIHLVLSDVVMPRMNARDLAKRLTSLRPGIRLLFMSGYSNNAVAHQGVLDKGIAFLQKPFTPGDLLRKVREVLDEPWQGGPRSGPLTTPA